MGFYFIKPWSFSLKAADLVLLFLALPPVLDRCMTFFSLTLWWSDTFNWTSLKRKKIRIAIKNALCSTYCTSSSSNQYIGNNMMIFVTVMKNPFTAIFSKQRVLFIAILLLEIKTFSLILEFEMWRCGMYGEVAGLIFCSFEVIAQIWLDPLRAFWGRWTTFVKNFFQKIYSFMLFWHSEEGFWPLTASITSRSKIIITILQCKEFWT